MDSFNLAETFLVNSAQIGAISKEEHQIVNRSLVMLGYLFYEKSKENSNNLAKAVSALRSIPDSSYYYEDALLGLGWCAIAASQAEDCIKACQKLRTVTTKKIIHAESMLLEAYAYTSQNKNTKALTLLKQANNLAQDLKNHPQHKIKEKNLSDKYIDSRKRYAALSDQISMLMLKEQNRNIEKVLDSLHAPQIEQQKKLLNLSISLDEVSRVSFFARNLKQVLADINWATIKIEGAMSIKKNEKVVKEVIKETKEIDEEMKKIQKELKQLDTEESPKDSTTDTDSTKFESNNNDTTISEEMDW